MTELECRDEQAAVVEKNQAAEVKARARRRQRLHGGEVPEQKLDQQRDVAEGLDVERAGGGDQSVRGAARERDDEAERGAERDGEETHQQRVEQRDDEDGEIGRIVAVRNERLRNVEARRPRQKPEAGLDAEAREI